MDRFPCVGDVTYPESLDGDAGELSDGLDPGAGQPGCLVWAADLWQSAHLRHQIGMLTSDRHACMYC